MIEIVRPGPLATVQDRGRRGLAHLGVPRSGAADLPSLDRANRLVGNPHDAAGIELTFGGARLRFGDPSWVAVTGAPAPVRAAGRPAPMNTVIRLPAGAELAIGTPTRGVRSYVAVRGGIATAPVLGSRATDLLSGLGGGPLAAGARLPIGPVVRADGGVGVADPVEEPPGGGDGTVLRMLAGPRTDWFSPRAPAILASTRYRVDPASNRVGVRLAGTPLPRARTEELPSEGLVPGAVQVPPDGRPIILLADHPTTGGYPVIGVVVSADLPRVAQLRPGGVLRFRPVGPGELIPGGPTG